MTNAAVSYEAAIWCLDAALRQRGSRVELELKRQPGSRPYYQATLTTRRGEGPADVRSNTLTADTLQEVLTALERTPSGWCAQCGAAYVGGEETIPMPITDLTSQTPTLPGRTRHAHADRCIRVLAQRLLVLEAR